MVELSSSGSGEGPGWVTAPGYSTAAFFREVEVSNPTAMAERQSVPAPLGSLAAGNKSALGGTAVRCFRCG